MFLDASKTFDKISYFKLPSKLLNRKTPISIVGILQFWYSKQTVFVKWELVCLNTVIYPTLSTVNMLGGGLKPGQDTKLSPHFKGYYTMHEFLGDTNVILKDQKETLLP